MTTIILIAITCLVSILCFTGALNGNIFAPLYLLYCWWAAKRNMDNIGHSAHFWGAVYGLVFPLVFNPSIFTHFISQLGF